MCAQNTKFGIIKKIHHRIVKEFPFHLTLSNAWRFLEQNAASNLLSKPESLRLSILNAFDCFEGELLIVSLGPKKNKIQICRKTVNLLNNIQFKKQQINRKTVNFLNNIQFITLLEFILK